MGSLTMPANEKEYLWFGERSPTQITDAVDSKTNAYLPLDCHIAFPNAGAVLSTTPLRIGRQGVPFPL
eukprot:8109697-Prorocentrum_lima.AAC.1